MTATSTDSAASTESRAYIGYTDPRDGRVIGSVPIDDASEVTAAADRARSNQVKWGIRFVAERAWMTRLALIDRAAFQPTIRRENTSVTKAM